MDLNELKAHARRHGKWTLRLSANETLSCQFYSQRASFALNGFFISQKRAERLLELAFEREMRA